jgi:hypothetical protein
MKARRTPFGLLVFTALGLTTIAEPLGAGTGFVVLVNRTNPAQTLSRSDLKRMVTGGTKQWDNGAVVQLGIIPANAPETQFLASLLDTTPRELLGRIQEQVFKGELRRPAILRSSADCLAFARVSAGGICVAPDGEWGTSDVHVVAIP